MTAPVELLKEIIARRPATSLRITASLRPVSHLLGGRVWLALLKIMSSTLGYAADAQHPDIFQLSKGSF
jgi:hypothetical protein